MFNFKYCLTALLIIACFSIKSKATPTEPDTLSLNKIMEEAGSFLTTYIQKESITGKEGAAGLYFSEYCQSKGLHMNYFSVKEDSYNFSASLYPLSLGKPNIVFLSHIDVVTPGEIELWDHPPFSGTLEDGYIWGRGAVDSKGLAAMQLMALLNIKERNVFKDLPYNITLLVVSNEESGGLKGSKIIADHFLDYLNPVVILGEGGSGMSGVISSKPEADVYGISIAEKTNLWLKLELNQLTNGHGATPSLNYANKSMISALNRLNNRKVKLKFNRSNRLMFRKVGQLEGGIRGFFIRKINWGILTPFVKNYIKSDPLFLSLLTNTVTVTNLFNPPGPPNKIADQSVAILDCRLLPGTNKKAFIRQIKKLIKEPSITVSIIDESPESEATRPDHFYKALEKAIASYDPTAYSVPILFPATSDNNYFRSKNIPVYGLIPAVLNEESIQSIHSINERISLKELESGIYIYTKFLQNMMQQKRTAPAKKVLTLE
jgi:acetylornithine deacetylase/succinyl-diaminopimelate desuccinylase-like protein